MTFDQPYVDIDEWRETRHPHRYVHGGFTGTETRFSFYFPAADRYQGRFFQHITPMPESEHLAQTATGQADKLGFAFGAGGYFVETNGGGPSGGPASGADPTIAGFRANAAAAEHSRDVAHRVYGEHRVYGYAYGGSGGAYRTIGCAENTAGVWDGFVPYVPGSPMAIPNVFTVRMHAQRILRGAFDCIVDSYDAGGDGDPSPALTEEQRQALTEVTKMGFPVRAWFGHRTMGSHAFTTVYPGIVAADPGYFEDFWTVPGHLGADPGSSVHRDRVRMSSVVASVVTRREGADLGPYAEAQRLRGGVDESFKGTAADEAVIALRLKELPEKSVQGAELIVRTGAAAGARLWLKGLYGDLAVLDRPDSDQLVGKVAAGDEVELDNSNFLAAQTYHRHQIPGPDFPAWDQFLAPDSAPLHPQRSILLGPLFTAGAAGHVPTGAFTGKMIIVACLLDREAFPWNAEWYRSKAATHAGDAVRLWYVDNALHGDDEHQEHPTYTVSYLGVLHEALRSVAAWAEEGIEPAPNTRIAISDGQVSVPESAAERGGVQPVVTVSVAGSARAEVQAGQPITIRAEAETPAGGAPIVRIQWDLDGDGVFEVDEPVEPTRHLVMERQGAYNEAGTRFMTVRVCAQRDGDPETSYGRVDNLGRARVVVSAEAVTETAA